MARAYSVASRARDFQTLSALTWVSISVQGSPGGILDREGLVVDAYT